MAQDDDEPTKLAVAAGLASLAAIAAAIPTSGVAALAAVVAQSLTNIEINGAWRRDAQDFWFEILIEEKSERERQYKETQDEFTRHRLILQWLQEELASVLDRMENLEVVALGMLQQSEGLLRQNSDPEMRPYLRNAFANAMRRPKYFTGTWMRRLVPLLEKLGAEHLAILLSCVAKARRDQPNAGILDFDLGTAGMNTSEKMAVRELILMKLWHQGAPSQLDFSAVRLAELVSPPQAQTTGDDAQ